MHRKRISRIICFALLGVAMLGCGCSQTAVSSEDSSQLADTKCIDTIKERGKLIVGCKTDIPELSFFDEKTDSWSGLETQLAYFTAAELFGVSYDDAVSRGLVEFKGVTVADREEKLDEGEIDILIATYTITDERKEKYSLSDSYYSDSIGLMIKKPVSDNETLGSVGINSITDLDGKYIGIPANATTRKDFLSYLDTLKNVDITPIFCEFQNYTDIYNALVNDKIDVMAVDVSILKGYCTDELTILDDRFATQNYGAAVLKENSALVEFVNKAEKNMVQ